MGFPFRSRLEHDARGSLIVVQMKDVDEANQLHIEDAVRVGLNDIREHHLLREGDLVFKSRGNSNSAAIVSPLPAPAVLAAPMLLIRPIKVLPAYLYWYLNLPSTQSALAQEAKGTSVRMISKASLEDLETPIPSRQVQQLIAETAQLVTREQWLMKRLTQERRRLADGILMRYATGQRQFTDA
jgi:hypothetical protein